MRYCIEWDAASNNDLLASRPEINSMFPVVGRWRLSDGYSGSYQSISLTEYYYESLHCSFFFISVWFYILGQAQRILLLKRERKDRGSKSGKGSHKKSHRNSYPGPIGTYKVWIINQGACMKPTYTLYIYVTVV